ncbi:MAG: DUF4398 domain-containing protein [Gammaproteobacteria bacterium]
MALGVCVALATLALAGCASPPVQEMSNARQAVHAAQVAGAPAHAPRIYAEAVHWLDDAEYALKRKDYSRARASAVRAVHAARAAGLAARKAHPPPPATSSPLLRRKTLTRAGLHGMSLA